MSIVDSIDNFITHNVVDPFKSWFNSSFFVEDQQPDMVSQAAPVAPSEDRAYEGFANNTNIQKLLEDFGLSQEAEQVKNRYYNSAEAALARQFAAKEAQKSRDWSERMSSTAYQRAVEDMRKAGINPILAVQQGGASSPTAATAQAHAASYQVGAGDTASRLISSFAQYGQYYTAMINAINNVVGTALDVLIPHRSVTRSVSDVTTHSYRGK